eukprot:TRINITY_DN35090_c0_g1_i1.p1 TRINITY_DN35090_c0_g1~~TRINITY_DN35090_c0_g1_i1.p1  ORF type:complete len:265 (+),score=44.70 TRINITY_DN35090_c0_g1_i1:46-840(+)
MFFRMGGMPGGFPGGGHPMMNRGPPPIAAPLEVTLEELVKGAKKEIDLDELADEEMKEMGLSGKMEVEIKKGHRQGIKIPYPGKGLKLPGSEERGMLSVVPRLSNDDPASSTYELHGPDLVTEKTITLTQALTGFSIEHNHIDGTVLNIKSTSIISPESHHVIKGKGLPAAENEEPPVELPPELDPNPGDLIIKFNIEFPHLMDDEQIALIKPALPSRHMVPAYDTEPEIVCELDSTNPADWSATAFEDDSDDEGGPQAQCTHQ